MGTGRVQLLVVSLAALAGVAVAWWVRTGRWRHRRLLPITIAVLAALVLLARRLGWGELLVVTVIVVPLLLLPAGLAGGDRGQR